MANILFTEDHEWISVENGVATVGITIHAQEQLGDLVFVELPDVGRTATKGEGIVVVEAVSSDPALINQAAEGEGWLFKLKLSDESQLSGLLDKAGYDKLVG